MQLAFGAKRVVGLSINRRMLRHPQDCNQRINLRQHLGVELQDLTATKDV